MPDAECVVCRHVITHPICGACLGEEMQEWLQETEPALLGELRATAEEMLLPHGKVKCILCKTNMDICSYCFTNHILDWLFDYPELVPEFLQFFNFDLQFSGYAEELLELV